jgi:hypothetical protein
MFKELFSKIYGFHLKKEISIREDAPEELRMGLFRLMKQCGIEPRKVQEIMSEVFLKRPDSSNFLNYDKTWAKLEALIFECEWFYIYDLCEESYKHIYSDLRRDFSSQINDLFQQLKIGWKFEGGKVVARESDEIETFIQRATTNLSLSNPALKELQEARRALNRRPVADLDAASQHCITAFEYVTRQITQNDEDDLGTLIKEHAWKFDIPAPLVIALEKMWEYTTEHAKQLKKQHKLTRNEVELLLGISSLMITYLYEIVRKKKNESTK